MKIYNEKLALAIMILCATLSCNASSARGSGELSFILSCNPIQSISERPHTRVDLSRVIGIKPLLTGSIRFYQLFISTQDAPVCNFIPTCSQFGMESIKRLGVIRGILLTSDRLQRCNGMSTSHYQMDYKSMRLIDPVQLYLEILQ
mgnify:CR=1 FL=1